MLENDRPKILWDFQIQTEKIVVVTNQPDFVVINEQQRTPIVINVAIPNHRKMWKKEHEKFEKYQDFREELESLKGEGNDSYWT